MRKVFVCLALVAGAFSATNIQAEQASSAGGDAVAGKVAYDNVCRTCHTSLAPPLEGVLGRNVAGVAAFDSYSAALKAKHELTWTPANLDAFLKSPSSFAPGTYMVQATPDDTVRANLIAYLQTQKAPAQP
ncbi:MAG TPA: cytochrome c family protein [Phenylobacterium sp.]